MPSVALTTVQQVKRYLRMTPPQITGGAGVSTVDDALIQDLVDQVTPVVERYCSRTFGVTTFDEVANGTGTSALALSNVPIIDVTSLAFLAPRTVASVAGNQTPLVRLVDYNFTAFSVQLYGGLRFPKGIGTVEIVYSAGFAEIPADIASAAAKICALRYHELGRLGQTSKTLGGSTVAFADVEFPKDVQGVLDRYNNRAIVTGRRVTVVA